MTLVSQDLVEELIIAKADIYDAANKYEWLLLAEKPGADNVLSEYDELLDRILFLNDCIELALLVER